MPVTINGNGSITGISAGGLPAGSLTLSKTDMPAGTVIQCVTDTTTLRTTNQTSTYVAINGLSITMTPRAANSKFYAIFEGHFYVDYGGSGSNNAHGFGYNIYKDDTRFTTSPNDSGGGENSERPYDWYNDGAHRTVARLMKTGQGTFGSTSAATFTVKFKGYNTSPLVQLNQDNANETQAQLTVMEIAV